MTGNLKKVIVIGAGLAGIATSIRLAIKGYSVEVFETASSPGGKLSEIRSGEFRFDAGPSLFTMPQYVDELFTLAGKNPCDYFRYERLDTICKYFFEDGTRLNAYSDRERFASEVEDATSDSAESVIKFLDQSEKIYQITDPVFLQRSLHQWKKYFNWTTVKSLLQFSQIDAFRTMNDSNSARFKDSKTIRLFNRYATYNGSNPYQAPATLNVIPHFEQYFGAYFPEGGMYSIVKSLTNLAIDCGVKFHFNTYVDEIGLSSKKISGVKVGEVTHEADMVVSNMDIWYTYRKLLKDIKAPERILQQERSSSALIFYWGVNKTFEELDLHNIFFTEDYEKEFHHIWQDKNISNDPTIYLNISSKREENDAPAGCENWFTMINVPSNSGQDWDELIQAARSNILSKLSRILKTDIASLILSEQILDPRKIDSQSFSYQGSLYGSSSNNQFAAFLRHANFSSKIEGLYFAGGSVHPGGGIPLALLSAKIVDGLIR
ncbi:MAG: 1-hydroxycarotenoid 3,4-desaturase CrtD [Daejeonella sp.]|uniref:1-hydroxycarotenoid 3,4-desaturase CrtD n=1 Tax=Daejeonella sp. TaxID=2805397 RepID=UPI003C785C79